MLKSDEEVILLSEEDEEILISRKGIDKNYQDMLNQDDIKGNKQLSVTQNYEVKEKPKIDSSNQVH